MLLDESETEPLVPLMPLEAFRRDARQPAVDERARDELSRWLAAAVMLARYAECDAVERLRLEPGLRESLRDSTAAKAFHGASIGALVRALADIAEDASALNLAVSLLALNESIHAADALERGRSIAQRARIARKAGELDIAHTLYEQVELLGKRSKLRELLSRAYVGYGIVAFVRGIYPDARRWYAQAAAIADELGIDDISSSAHQSLMITAGEAGELDAALVEGWTAFRFAAGKPDREAEMLTCLGQLLIKAGQVPASRSAFAAALQRTMLPRLTLPAWSGLAVASSYAKDTRLVDLAAGEIARISDWQRLPYPAVSAAFELAIAYAHLGRRSAADTHREQALAHARKHGFNEFVYRAESLGEEMDMSTPIRHPLTSAGSDVVAELEILGDVEALVSEP